VFGVRILLFLVAYLVVLAEMIAGALTTKAIQGYVWIGVGAVVIMLLLALSNFILPTIYSDNAKQRFPKPFEWLIMAIASVFITGTAFYFEVFIKDFMIS